MNTRLSHFDPSQLHLNWIRSSPPVAAILLVIALSGCNAEVGTPDVDLDNAWPQAVLAGEWEGRLATTNGARERAIRATITPVGDGTYRAQCSTTIGLGIPVESAAVLRTTRSDGVLHIEAAPLDGWMLANRRRLNGRFDGAALVLNIPMGNGSATLRLLRPTAARGPAARDSRELVDFRSLRLEADAPSAVGG